MKDALASKTVQLALVFAGMGLCLIAADTTVSYLIGEHLKFVIEFFGLLGTMFTGIAAKNGADNFISFQREKTTMMANLPPNAPPLPEA